MSEFGTTLSPELLGAVVILTAGRSPIEWSAAIEANPDLLSPRAAALLAHLRSDAPPQMAGHLGDVASFVDRSRTIGASEAAAEYGDLDRIAPGLRNKYLRAVEVASSGIAEKIAALWKDCIRDECFSAAPSRFQVKLLLNSATTILMEADGTSATGLDEAEGFLRQGLATAGLAAPVRGMLLSTLGELQRQRFILLGDLNQIAAAIDSHQEAVRLTPEFSPRRPMHLKGRIQACQAASESGGGIEELNQAILFEAELVEYLMVAGPHDQYYVGEVASYYTLLFERTRVDGNVSDLQTAANATERAFGQLDGDSRATILALRGEIYFESYENVSPEVGDLHRARVCLRGALEMASPSWPSRLACLMVAGNVFDRLIRAGVTDALAEWAHTADQALKIAGDAEARANALGNVGRYLGARFGTSADRKDLDGSIDWLREAIRLAKSNGVLDSLHTSLGQFLHERYDRYGDENDLDAAGEAYDHALRATDPRSPNYALRLNNKAVVARERYDRGAGPSNLDAAIELTERAIERYRQSGSFRNLLHHNLGFCLRQRYQLCRRAEDLTRALSEHEKAIDGLPSQSEHLSTFLSNFGAALLEQHWAAQDFEALERAIEVRQRAYDLVPEGTPNKVVVSHQLASALAARFDLRQSQDDLGAARELFRQAAGRGLNVHLEEALVGARNWLLWAFPREAWEEVDEAFELAEQAISRLLVQQVLRSTKESWINVSQSLAPRAAFARARLGKCKGAVVALERDRARLTTEALQRNAAAVLALRDSANSELYTRFASLSARLNAPVLSDAGAPKAVATDDLRAIRADLDKAIEEIRLIPGNHGFLAQPGWEGIAAVAVDQRLIYFAATALGSVALIVSTADGESINPVWLPQLTDCPLEQQFEAWAAGAGQKEPAHALGAELEPIGRWLWDVVMQPIVEALPRQAAAVLIPGGMVGRLPLHAAWVEAPSSPPGRTYALDLLRIRYSPNAVALAAASSVVADAKAGSIVAILDPQPVADKPLPHARYEADLALTVLSKPLRLAGPDATVDKVRDALPKYSVAHFACHGKASPLAPLKSALLLSGNTPLELADVLDLRLTGARLAVLSACETAVVGTGLPDELIGLPTGFVQAGYPGVIASLWPIGDEGTALLMTRFYAYWLLEQLAPDEALRQAQRWLRDSSNAEILEFLLASPLSQEAKEHWRSHLASLEPRHQQRSALFHWAGFVYVGA